MSKTNSEKTGQCGKSREVSIIGGTGRRGHKGEWVIVVGVQAQARATIVVMNS